MGKEERSKMEKGKGDWKASDSPQITSESPEGRNPAGVTKVSLGLDGGWAALSALSTPPKATQGT